MPPCEHVWVYPKLHDARSFGKVRDLRRCRSCGEEEIRDRFLGAAIRTKGEWKPHARQVVIVVLDGLNNRTLCGPYNSRREATAATNGRHIPGYFYLSDLKDIEDCSVPADEWRTWWHTLGSGQWVGTGGTDAQRPVRG